jgi:hypothetical protein
MEKRKQVGKRRLNGFCVAVSQTMDEQMTPTALLDLHRLVDLLESCSRDSGGSCAAGVDDLIDA